MFKVEYFQEKKNIVDLNPPKPLSFVGDGHNLFIYLFIYLCIYFYTYVKVNIFHFFFIFDKNALEFYL